MRSLFLLVALFCIPSLVVASSDVEERAHKLFREIKCPVCSGQSIAESSADIAINIKEVITRKILAGESDAEIKLFLVTAYGDSILFEPPVNSYTLLLWYGPFVFLLLLIILAQLRRA